MCGIDLCCTKLQMIKVFKENQRILNNTHFGGKAKTSNIKCNSNAVNIAFTEIQKAMFELQRCVGKGKTVCVNISTLYA